MRRSFMCKNVPVIILSSSDLQKDIDESLRLGASHYLRKPLQLEEFLSLGAIFKSVLIGPRSE
jgi:DNA-binding response OmpR family regulator